MKASRSSFIAGFFAAIALLGATAGGFVLLEAGAAAAPVAASASLRLPLADYGPQKVVYHVASKGSWRDREGEAWRLISVINNHVNAVEPDPVDLQIVFQGDGIDALKRARSNPRLASAFDALKARGVKLRVCANTLEAFKLSLETLHGIKEVDLVQAAVAEFVHLQQKGYSYIRF